MSIREEITATDVYKNALKLMPEAEKSVLEEYINLMISKLETMTTGITTLAAQEEMREKMREEIIKMMKEQKIARKQ